MEAQSFSQGYYHATICVRSHQTLLQSNTERAFILAQLQDLLSPRLFIGDVPAYKQLASCIDLLGFSITPSAIQLVLFTIDRTVATHLCERVVDRFAQYRDDLHLNNNRYAPPDISVSLKKLRGPHHALAQVTTLHLNHEDWEYDRYSSIGFYLHDRRGDWMRTWRLARLYENSAMNYYQLILGKLDASRASMSANFQVLAP